MQTRFDDLGAKREGLRRWSTRPYMSGGTLTQVTGRLSKQQLQPLASGLAKVFASVHDKCGAHGDYKPDNIMVAQDGKFKLGDPAGLCQRCKTRQYF